MTPRAHRIAARVVSGGWVLATGLGLFCGGFLLAPARAADLGTDPLPSPAALEVFNTQVRPLFEQYCYHCHSGANAEGGLALDAYQDGAKLIEDPARWRTIAERLRDGDMPPDGEAQPDAAQLESLVAWIERQVAAAERGRVRDPGRVTMRRLNRVEYNNTIRDLIGLDFHPADDFPADDVGYGFDNNGDVLSLPPLLMEKYLAAAQKIADAAIVGPPEPSAVGRRRCAAHHSSRSGQGLWRYRAGSSMATAN